MTTGILVSALIVSLLCALGASVAEWTLSLRRSRPLRWVWVAAMSASVVVPLTRATIGRTTLWEQIGATTSPSREKMTSHAAEAAGEGNNAVPRGEAKHTTTAIDLPAAATVSRRTYALTVPSLSARALRLFSAVWLGTSICLFLALFWSLRQLARESRSWRRSTLHQTAVLVSDDFGPATIGLLRPQIVVPTWVLGLDAGASSTVLAHEIEHQRAGDSRLIASALCLCAAVPWNPMLWWMSTRLVRAIEFDCDARVVASGIRPATYAELLLQAWRHGDASRRVALAVAFAERGSRLGRRIRHLLRPEPQGWRMRSLLGASLTIGLAALALAAPTVEPRTVVPETLVLIDGVVRSDLRSDEMKGVELRARSGAAAIAWSGWLSPSNARRLFGDLGARGADLWWSQGYVDRGGPQLPVLQMLLERRPGRLCPAPAVNVARRLAPRLLAGIDPSPAQRIEVERIVTAYASDLRAVVLKPEIVRGPRMVAITNRRDAALRSVFPDEAQRAILDNNVKAERRFLVTNDAKELAAMLVRVNYFAEASVSAAETMAATQVVERFLLAEASLHARQPLDTIALWTLEGKRDEDLRAILLSEAARSTYDRGRWIRQGMKRVEAEIVCED